eukprot:758738-Hanusia_phi.AAC.2
MGRGKFFVREVIKGETQGESRQTKGGRGRMEERAGGRGERGWCAMGRGGGKGGRVRNWRNGYLSFSFYFTRIGVFPKGM